MGGEFLSTLPVRGATRYTVYETHREGISIHAPREGSDCTAGAFTWTFAAFLSTLPVRGATQADFRRSMFRTISIHAPREGSDVR